MIEAIDLRKSYGTFEAVKGVSFTIKTGCIVGLLGPNGAGKTTILKVLTGYHWPSAGQARLDGIDVVEDSLAVKQRLGYLPENAPVYPDLTVAEYLEFIAASRGFSGGGKTQAVERSVEVCGLKKVYDVPIEKLSKGFRQRAGLAQAILHDPGILILDEPTSGLDPNQILEIRSLIRALGEKKTVILSTHILQEVEALCDEVLIMNEGLIVAEGSTETIAETLMGEERFDILLKADPESVSARIGALSAFTLAGKPESPGNGITRLKLVASGAESGFDSAESVFDWAVDSHFKILEMQRERLSLEEIFVKLTREEKTP